MSALSTFAAGLTPGVWTQYPNASLAAPKPSGGYVFEPTDAAKAAALAGGWSAVHMADWHARMPHYVHADGSRSWWQAGGRDRLQPLASNLVSYHEATDEWIHRGEPWAGVGSGHCYHSTAVMQEPGLVAYLPTTVSQIMLWDIVADAPAGSIPAPPRTIVPPYSSGWSLATALEWAPNMGPAGSLIYVNCVASSTNPLLRVCRFDWASQTWLPIFGDRTTCNINTVVACYLPAAGVTVVGGSVPTAPRVLSVIDSAGAVTQTPVCPGSTGPGGSTRGVTFAHPDGNQIIVLCRNTARVYSWAPGEPAWTDRGPLPAHLCTVNTTAFGTDFGAVAVEYSPLGASTMHAWVPDF